MHSYGQNPGVTYLRVSDDEVIARGGHLDGFSLIISDDTGRGLASRIVDELADGTSAQAVSDAVADTHDVSVDEIERFLEEMHESGVALKLDHARPEVADWLAFARFGELAAGPALGPLVIVGSDVAAMLAQRLQSLGVDAQHRSWADLQIDDLGEFAVAEVTSDPREEPASPQEPETRLIALVDGGSLQPLYDLNERAVGAGIPVLYLQVAGVEYAVGPYVVPDSTACFWEFERQRARSVFSYSEYAVMAAGAMRAGGANAAPAIAQHALVAAATPFLVELAMLGESSLAGQLLRGRATTADTARQYVMRLPRCPVCLPRRPAIRNPLF